MTSTAADDAPLDLARLRQWIGRTEVVSDVIAPGPAAMLAATLDRDDGEPRPGDALPALWHWLYFLDRTPRRALGDDGHARRGVFLPPVALPRRMWAGGRLTFARPLLIGEAVTRTSTVVDLAHKDGRSGPLVFVTVRHEIAGTDGIVAVTEEHDIVYRGRPDPAAAPPVPPAAPADAEWSMAVVPDAVLLFRYSALTFNGHRIHYDRPFCTEHEGYPGLVVHGPLLATLLLDLFGRAVPGARVTGFSFRAVAPVFDTAAFAVEGRPDSGGDAADLWVRGADGGLCMAARVEAPGWSGHAPHRHPDDV